MLKRHVFKLVFRVLLLAAALFLYFSNSGLLNFTNMFDRGISAVFLWIVWVVFTLEMLYRIIPNKRITVGSRKHYACSFRPVPSDMISGKQCGEIAEGGELEKASLHRGIALSAAFWFVITAAVILALRLIGILSPSSVLLWVLLLAVADLVFVLFLCPFRVLFLRNNCCVDCRIFNWDYFMMFAPLIIFPSFFSVSLVLLSVAVVVRWEIAVLRHPQYFLKETNANLSCEFCEDKLCRFSKRIYKNH